MLDVVAVDLGGTNLRAAFFPAAQSQPATQRKIPTQAHEGTEAVLKRLVTLIRDVTPSGQRGLRIGVAAPGPLDPRRGMVYGAPNLPGWQAVPLRDRLADALGCPVVVGNDANLGALGEWRHGAGQGVENLLYLTIGTGIGAGVIADGRLLLGARGLAAELGHMTVVPDGPACGCGLRGHLEAVANGPALARQAIERIQAGEHSSLEKDVRAGKHIDGRDVGQAARAGDSLAVDIVTRAGEAIGSHLASLVHAFNPEVIVLGGGVSSLGPVLLEPMERRLHAELMSPVYAEGLRLVPAALGDDAGLIGAMVLARET
jgi:glucokinase